VRWKGKYANDTILRRVEPRTQCLNATQHLGIAAYGMIPLANSLVMYGSIISTSLDVSINRFLAIEINQGSERGANRTFNTALALSLAASGVLLLPATLVTYYFPFLFNIPAGLERSTQFLFVGVFISMLAEILSGNFGVISMITHRFYLRNIVRVLMSLSRMGIVVICFLVWPASLWSIAAGFIVSASVGLLGDVLLWKRLAPQLHIGHGYIDRHQFRALAGLSGWAAVNQAGTLLLMQVNILVVSAIFGADMTGRYGTVSLFPSLIFTMTDTVVAVLSPAIMARYALGDVASMRGIARRAVKLLGIGLALPIGLLCGLGQPLLNLWLGPEFVRMDVLLILLLCHLPINLAVRPLGYVLTAYNRIKIQSLITLPLGIANVALAIAFARWSGWGVAGVAAATAIVWTIKNALFLSTYSALLMRLRWWEFYAPLTAGALGTLGVALAGRFVSHLWWPASWVSLGFVSAAVSIAYCAIALAVSLNGSDRALLSSLMRRRSSD
jgi:membrane protein EpsK